MQIRLYGLFYKIIFEKFGSLKILLYFRTIFLKSK